MSWWQFFILSPAEENNTIKKRKKKKRERESEVKKLAKSKRNWKETCKHIQKKGKKVQTQAKKLKHRHCCSFQHPCMLPWLSLAGWLPLPCSIPGDVQPRLGRVVMPWGNFWQPQSRLKLLPLLLQDCSQLWKNLFYASVLLQVDFYLSKATLKFPTECPANTYLFTVMGFGKHAAGTVVCFICVLSHFHPNRGCCSGHLPGYLVAGSEQAPACGQVSSAAWLSTGGPWAFLHVKIQ